MRVVKPRFFDRFRCIAAACPDSCCHQWAVQVDDEAAAYYAALPGAMGEQIRSALIREDGDLIFRLVGDRCAMWRDDGLCRIQAQLGEAALCKTCREFPRITQDYGTFAELGLEMSCPEAARIMLCDGDWSMEETEAEGGEEPEYDAQAMELLRAARPTALSILEGSVRTVGEDLAILLLHAYEVQNVLDGGEEAPFDPDAALAVARQMAGEGNGDAILAFLRELEILTPQWAALLDEPPEEDRWFEELRKLARYGIYRYYYQAVSDYDLVSRVKLIILYCLTAKRLGGGTEQSRIRAIQLFGKEIENDAQNVDAILDGAYSSPALTDRNLLSLLIN